MSPSNISGSYRIREARYGWLIREEERVYEYRVEGKLARKGRRFRLIDVFAGAGGMTLGFSKSFGHAFDPVWANDFDGSSVTIRLEHVPAEHF